MNDEYYQLDDRSALILYLADELPLELRHELDERLAAEPELARMLEEIRELEREVHRMMDVEGADIRGESRARGMMAAIRRIAMAPAGAGTVCETNPMDRRRRRMGIVGYVGFGAAACLALGLGLWTLGIFNGQSPDNGNRKGNGMPTKAMVDLDEDFLAPSDALTPRLNEVSEHLRALQSDLPDDQWLMMM